MMTKNKIEVKKYIEKFLMGVYFVLLSILVFFWIGHELFPKMMPHDLVLGLYEYDLSPLIVYWKLIFACLFVIFLLSIFFSKNNFLGTVVLLLFSYAILNPNVYNNEHLRFYKRNHISPVLKIKRTHFNDNVEVKMKSRLGNNMFQYAAAYAYAKKHNKKLFIFNQNNSRLPDIFNISAPLSDKNNPDLFSNFPDEKKYKDIKKYQYSSFYQFEPKQYEDPRYIFYSGFFWNPDFFKEYENEIRKEFSFRNRLPSKLNNLVEEMISQNSICIHFRRTDYAKKGFGMDLDYYKKAISHLKKRLKNPVFYVFSDDIEWVKHNFSFTDPHVYVSEITKEMPPEIDLQLMTKCENFIISNSTFSWWGAWLSSRPNKIVVAPGGTWIGDEVAKKHNKHDFTETIIPKNWETIFALRVNE